MSVRKRPTVAARVFAAKPAGLSGSVKLVAPRAAARASYEWEVSTDGGKTFAPRPPTLKAKTIVTDLVPASTAYFRYRATTTAGQGDWSQVVWIIVT